MLTVTCDAVFSGCESFASGLHWLLRYLNCSGKRVVQKPLNHRGKLGGETFTASQPFVYFVVQSMNHQGLRSGSAWLSVEQRRADGAPVTHVPGRYSER